MKVAIVFEPDLDLGTDPLDEHNTPRRLGEFLDSDRMDVLVAWREWGDQFEDGFRTHFVGSGIWENLTEEQYDDLLGLLNNGLPE